VILRRTLFMISENIKAVRELHPGTKGLSIGVVGCGYTGANLVEYLSQVLNDKVVAFDTSRRVSNFEHAEFVGDDFTRIEECGIVIILTTQGNSGIESIISHLNPYSVVISDTHPKITRSRWQEVNKKVSGCYESATIYPGSWFFPSFPRWNNKTVPGCVVQAIVESVYDIKFEEQEQFNRYAIECGFVARLDKPECIND